MEQQDTGKNQKNGRKGFTTGTCGAAAALAAAVLFFEGEEVNQVSLTTPDGTSLQIAIARAVAEEDFACCGVVKDAGDDPDVTDGALVLVTISQDPEKGIETKREKEPKNTPKSAQKNQELLSGKGIKTAAQWYEYQPEAEKGDDKFSLFLRGGKGIGIVTREGLSCPTGMWAINPVPRKMIFEQVAAVCRRCDISGSVYITIEIPDGKKLAEKTFNPRLGIEGGLSILGTSGIVEPMSERALLETICLEIRQKQAEGRKALLVVPGNYGEQFVSDYMGMSLADGVKCSNYIGETIDMAVEAGMEKLLFVGHAGKLLKVAAGIMNTHSAVADGRMECLAAYGAASGASAEMVCRILNCVTVDEALGILEEVNGLRDEAIELAMERIHENMKRRAKGFLQIEAVLFTNDRGILGVTAGAIGMIDKMAPG